MGVGCTVHCNKVSKPVVMHEEHCVVTSYTDTLITFLKVLSNFIMKIKNFIKYFKEGVLKYFKIRKFSG